MNRKLPRRFTLAELDARVAREGYFSLDKDERKAWRRMSGAEIPPKLSPTYHNTLQGCRGGQRQYPIDTVTPLPLLRDAIEAQVLRARGLLEQCLQPLRRVA